MIGLLFKFIAGLIKIIAGLTVCFFVLFSQTVQSQDIAQTPDIVRTKAGLIAGALNATGDVRIFKGVPYAAPPVGELRWKEPQPLTPWEGVRKCDQFGPNAIQRKHPPRGAYGEEILIPTNGKLSEDCLYLNVWVPATPANQQLTTNGKQAKMPVIVIVHGGTLLEGSGSVAVLNGEETAKKGVIVVTINYRVGILGFLAHPALSRESPHHASGNYGILDMIAAFHWVKENIAAFGGDPDNITADGGSAGSCGLLTIIASPLGKGLFRRMISESGPLLKPDCLPTLTQREQEGLETMNKAHAATLEEMRALPDSVLLQYNQFRFPAVDNYLLREQVLNIFLAGKQNDVDLLIGYNEGDEDIDESIVPAAAFTENARKRYGPRAADFLKIYPAHTDAEAEQSQYAVSRDTVFALQNYVCAKWQSRHGNRKTYFFYFCRSSPGTPDYGAFHGSQSAYVLHNLDKWKRPFKEWDRTLSNSMNQYWVDFAKTGNPNGKGLPAWPAFTSEHPKVMQFGDTIKPVDLPATQAFPFVDPGSNP
ncbi:MAG: carboxylesterase family protein [Puia sp.]|nr:carboxylesterase family protein [Puia sp.]